MSLYKRVSQVADPAALESLRAEVKDRYSTFPPSVESLFAYARLRLRAEALAIAQVDAASSSLLLRFAPETTLTPRALVLAQAGLPGSRLHPEGLKVALAAGQPPLAALDEALAALEQAAASPNL
jgi:transcription-repair coupling factor (superfamily II helicase)